MVIQNPKTEYSKREKFVNPDECYTPEYAINPLLPYLREGWRIWDCAFGSGRLAEHFGKAGFEVAKKIISDGEINKSIPEMINDAREQLGLPFEDRSNPQVDMF